MRIVPKAEVIAELRIKKGLSRERLAKVAGIAEQTINRVEEGCSLRPSTARKIQSALETDFETIYTLEK